MKHYPHLTFGILSIWLISGFLLPLMPIAQANESLGQWIATDVDGDGLPNAVEETGWCNEKGCFRTDMFDPDSDDDGLTDGEEKLFESIPNGPDGVSSPGLYVIYEDTLKTKEYYPWQPYGHKFIARADNFVPPRPDEQDSRRGVTDLDAVVVRRGSTIFVGGPINATLQIEKSSSSLTTLNPVRDPFTGGWQITIPEKGTVGKYTLKLGGERMDLFVIFELPKSSGELTQNGVDRFVYDDNFDNLRDQSAVLLVDLQYPPEFGSPYPGLLNDTNYVNEGRTYIFKTQHYQRFMLEDYVIKAINGKTSQRSAADALTDRVDALTVFRNPRPLTSSQAVLNPGANPRQQCSNIGGILAAFARTAGIASRPVMVDWKASTFDHSTEMWLNGTWYAYRGYNKFEIGVAPDNTHLGCGSSTWPRCGAVKYRTRLSWGGSGDYNPGSGALIVVAGDNWTELGLAYRSGSWARNVIRLNENRLKTALRAYWGRSEPQNLGLPGWPPSPSSSAPILTANESNLSALSGQVQLGNVVKEYTLDTNGNGQYDQLILEVEVTVPQPGRYWLLGQLSASQPNSDLMTTGGVVAEALVNPELKAGTQIVPLVFDGLEIGPKSVDGPYLLSGVWITDKDEPNPSTFMNESLGYRANLYTTQAYQAAMFETYGAVLASQYRHNLVDSNGDGRVDGLVVQTELNVFRLGTYRIEGVLYDGQNKYIAYASTTSQGGTVQLEFAGISGRVGPYQLEEVRVLNEVGESVDETPQPYVIEPDAALAQPAIASFIIAIPPGNPTTFSATITPTRIFNTQVVNGDLQLNAQVNVAQAGSYKLEAWLADGDGNLVTWAAGAPTALGVGIQNLALTFKGSNLQARGIAGPYQVVALKILSGQETYRVLDRVDMAMITPPYSLSDFTPMSQVLFADFAQNGGNQWAIEAPWTIVKERNLYVSPSSAWSGVNGDGSLRTIVSLNLSRVTSVGLKFQTSYSFKTGSAGYLEISTDGGSTWRSIATFTGNRSWSEETQIINLNPYINRSNPSLQFRFRLAAANGGTWKVDDIVIGSVPDRDGDGLSDEDEPQYGTDPDNPDSDGDSLPDGWEVEHGFDPHNPNGDNGGAGDPDGDGLINIHEYLYGTDPHNPDTDGDGLPDGWEVHYDLNPNDSTGDNGATGDPDDDDLTNLVEYQNGTDPRNHDTDNDGVPDNQDPRNDFLYWLPLLSK